MDKSELKQQIEREIVETNRLVHEYRELSKPVAPDVAIGRVSRMDAINNKSVTESVLRKAEEKLKKLSYVLKKIDSDDFGICIKCGKPIPAGRIMVRPESLHCVKCAG